jgi:CheY-like chemotaxis protein
MKVLIVDDNPTNLKLLRAKLEAEGHCVAQAADGVEALQLLEREGTDAIVSDILMPRMDGYRLCHEVRNRERFGNLPFIFYTATYTSPGDEKFSLELGADLFLRKPASTAEIAEALRHVTREGRELRAVPRTAMPESDVVKEYSERLVFKLEQKNLKLAQTLEELRSERAHPGGAIAYFSMEIGLESGLPTYSGGLGMLAGDTIRWWRSPYCTERAILLRASIPGDGSRRGRSNGGRRNF